MKVLITGGMGFIGKAITQVLLKRDVATIYILDTLSSKIHGDSPIPHDFKDKRVVFVRGDVSRREDIEPLLLSCDAVVHLAAETGTGQSMYEIDLYNRINISATALMLDILTNQKNNVKKIVVASSRAIYGEGKYHCPDHGIVYPDLRSTSDMGKGDYEVKCPHCRRSPELLPTSEDSLIHPLSFYGITKQFQEAIIMTLCANIGIASTALRYQNVYGPGQSLHNPYTGILSIFSKLILRRSPVPVFEDGKESRDLVFIDDVAAATVEALHIDQANGEVINIGSGSATSVLTVARKLRDLFQSKVKIEINGKYRVGDIRHNYADVTKMNKILKMSSATPLDQGLALFADWVQQQDLGMDRYDESIGELESRGLFKSFNA